MCYCDWSVFNKIIIEIKSGVAQVTLNNVQGAMFDGWDTLLIGNRYNWSQWMQSLKAKMKDAEQAEVNYNILYFLIIVGSIIPIIIVTMKMILNNLNSVGMLTTILLTLPRQVSNIQYLSIVIKYLTELVGFKEKINNINNKYSEIFASTPASALYRTDAVQHGARPREL